MESYGKYFNNLSLLLSVLAIFFSGYSILQNQKYHSDATTIQLLNDSYNSFHELSTLLLNNPLHSHLLMVPEKYVEVKNEINEVTIETEKLKVKEFILQERVIATAIFQKFESVFFQHAQANLIGDKEREKFLKEVLNYYTGRLLRNPRLLYYWNAEGDNLQVYFELEVRNFYINNVVFNSDDLDHRGVFGGL